MCKILTQLIFIYINNCFPLRSYSCMTFSLFQLNRIIEWRYCCVCPSPAGGDALRRVRWQSEERHYLGQPLLHPVPRRHPRQGQRPRQRDGRLRCRQGRNMAQRRLHLCECSLFLLWLESEVKQRKSCNSLIFRVIFTLRPHIVLFFPCLDLPACFPSGLIVSVLFSNLHLPPADSAAARRSRHQSQEAVQRHVCC